MSVSSSCLCVGVAQCAFQAEEDFTGTLHKIQTKSPFAVYLANGDSTFCAAEDAALAVCCCCFISERN